MIVETEGSVSKVHFSGAVNDLTIEFEDGKVMEIRQDKNTNEVYMICHCGNFMLKKKTENMIYIQIK